MVIGTVPCNLGREAGKFGRHSCTCLSLAVGQPHSTTETTKGWRKGGGEMVAIGYGKEIRLELKKLREGVMTEDQEAAWKEISE